MSAPFSRSSWASLALPSDTAARNASPPNLFTVIPACSSTRIFSGRLPQRTSWKARSFCFGLSFAACPAKSATTSGPQQRAAVSSRGCSSARPGSAPCSSRKWIMGTSFRKTAISSGISLIYSLSWMGTSKSRPPWSIASSLGVSWSQMAAAVSGRVSQRPIYAIWYIRHLLSLSYNSSFLYRQIVVIHGDQFPGGLRGVHMNQVLTPQASILVTVKKSVPAGVGFLASR